MYHISALSLTMPICALSLDKHLFLITSLCRSKDAIFECLFIISLSVSLSLCLCGFRCLCVCVASDGKKVQGEKCSPALPCSGSSHLEKRTIPAVISTPNNLYSIFIHKPNSFCPLTSNKCVKTGNKLKMHMTAHAG